MPTQPAAALENGVHHTQVRVRFGDTDPYGIVYFVSYFRYCHRAIEDFLRACGLPPEETFKNVPEGFGLPILEAMACGVIPVATRVGGVPELITDGRDGYLEAVGDISAQAARVAWPSRVRRHGPFRRCHDDRRREEAGDERHRPREGPGPAAGTSPGPRRPVERPVAALVVVAHFVEEKIIAVL